MVFCLDTDPRCFIFHVKELDLIALQMHDSFIHNAALLLYPESGCAHFGDTVDK